MTRIVIRSLAVAALALLADCADGLEPVPFQGVSGTVRFVGGVPAGTDWVRLAAYEEIPGSELEFLSFAAISDTLPLGADSAVYVLGLPNGVYEWLAVFWKPAGAPLSPGTLRVLGWYTDGGPFDPPRPFLVKTDEETVGIDLTADFGSGLTLAEALEALRR